MFKKVLLTILVVIVVVLSVGYWYLSSYLPNPPAAPDIQVEITTDRIERGRYLANHVSVCMDCHAVRDWQYFSAPPIPETMGAGGDRFGREFGFPGEVYAKNLTPTNLSSYTDGELFRAITTGVDRNDRVLFPMMPFTQYAYFAEEDVKSLIAYIRTLEPVEGNYPDKVLDFPLNLIINTLGGTFQGPKTPPSPSDNLVYGEYLVRIAACNDCHYSGTIHQPDLSRPFAGGIEFGLPGGIVVRSGNLTPDTETGIGNWSKEYFIERFKMHDPEETPYMPVELGQFNSVMPWTMYAGMSEEDLGAIYDYLRTIEPVHNPVVKFTPPATE